MKPKKKPNQSPKPQSSQPLTEAFGKLIPKSNLNTDLKHKVKEYIDKLNDSSTRENAFQSLKQIISKYNSLDQIKIILPLLTSYSSAVPSQTGREYQIILIAYAIKMGYLSNCEHSVLSKLLDVVTCYLSDNSINIHKGCSIVVIEIFDLIMNNENIESALGFVYRFFSNVVNKHHADVPKEENNGVVNGSFAIVNDIISYVITLYKEGNTNNNNNNAHCESVDVPSQQQNQPNDNNNDNADEKQPLHQMVPNELNQHLSNVLIDLLKLLKTYKFTNPNLLEGIAHLIDVVPYANYYNSLKSVIPQLLQILYSNNTQIYLSKIEVCNILHHLGLKTQSSPSITEDVNVNDICGALSYAMKDRVVKVQVAASEALQCWNKKESESKERRVSRLNLLRNLSKINKEKNVVMSSVQVRKEVYDVGIGKFLRTASFISNREEEGLIKLKGLWEKKKKGEGDNSEESKVKDNKERIRSDKKGRKGGSKDKFEMCAKQQWERRKEEELDKEKGKEDSEGKGKESRKGSGDNKRKEMVRFEEEAGIIGDNLGNVEGKINGNGEGEAENEKESDVNEHNKEDEGNEDHSGETIKGDLKDDMKGKDENNQDEQNKEEEVSELHRKNEENNNSQEMDNEDGIEDDEMHKSASKEHEPNDIDDNYLNDEANNEHHSNKNGSNENDNDPSYKEDIEGNESHKENELNEDDIDKDDEAGNNNPQLNAKEFSENQHQSINKEEEVISHHSNSKHQSKHEEEHKEQSLEEQKSYPQDVIPEEDENDEEQSIHNERPSVKPSHRSSQKVLLNINKPSSKLLFEEEQNVKADELGVEYPPEEQNSFIINNNSNNNSLHKSSSQHSNISLHQTQKHKAYVNKPVQEVDSTRLQKDVPINKELAPIIKQKHSHKQQPKCSSNITPLLNNLQSYFTSQLEHTFSSFENQIHSTLSQLNTKLNTISSKLTALQVPNPNTPAVTNRHTSNINLLNNSTSSIKSQQKPIPPSIHTSHFSNNTSIPLWELILSYIHANNYTQAYTAALQSSDDLLLIRLLFLTGPQPLSQIPFALCKSLLLHLNSIYRCFMLHNLITDFIGEYVHMFPLASLTLRELNELLQTLYEISFLANATGNKAKTIYKEIKHEYNRS